MRYDFSMKSPDWFDLKNYTPSNNPAYWHWQISNRMMIRHVIEIKDHSESPREFFAEEIKGVMDVWTNNAKANDASSWRENHRHLRAAHFLDLDYLSKIRGWMMEPELAEAMEQVITPEEIADVSRQFRKYMEENDEPTEQMLKPEERPGYGILAELARRMNFARRSLLDFIKDEESKNMAIVINPHADMASILSDVEVLVTEIRKASFTPVFKKPIGNKEFADWFTYGFLPCWDLVQWGQLTGQKITNAELGDLLWPNASFDRAERVRKTTRRRYSKIFSDSTLKRLEQS